VNSVQTRTSFTRRNTGISGREMKTF